MGARDGLAEAVLWWGSGTSNFNSAVRTDTHAKPFAGRMKFECQNPCLYPDCLSCQAALCRSANVPAAVGKPGTGKRAGGWGGTGVVFFGKACKSPPRVHRRCRAHLIKRLH